MKILLDEDLPPVVAEVLRGLGYDASSVHEIGRRGLTDEEQLVFAASEGRVLVTRNRDDFLRLSVDFFQALRPHQGVLIVPRSLSSRHPEALAHALARWISSQTAPEQDRSYWVDFVRP